jgi:exopolysaccharide biosynthesis polyprenyl glycosylphosphotransferase
MPLDGAVDDVRLAPATRPLRSHLLSTAARRKAAVAASDALAVSLALAATVVFTASSAPRLHLLVLAVPAWLASIAHFRLYSSQSVYRRPDELGRIVHAAGAASLAVVFVAFMIRTGVTRSWALESFGFGTLALLVDREIVRRLFARMRRTGRLLRPVLVVGANSEAERLVDLLSTDSALGYQVVGVLDDASELGRRVGASTVVGSVDDVVNVAAATGAGGAVIAATAVDLARSNWLARSLTEAGLHVEISSSLLDIAPERLCIQPLGRVPVVYVRAVRYDGWRAVFKRSFDVAVSVLMLMVSFPMLVAIAVAVKLDSRGPVLFKQERVGRNGRPFKVYKFRSMVLDAEERLEGLLDQNEMDGPLFKLRNDPRVTRVGAVIRKLSLDELPQFLNVVRGEMSLVGPRPALERELAGWAPELHHRLRVKPGITGMWQVSGRNELSFDDYARLDLYYVDNWSPWTDLAILAKTVPTVLLRRGVY